MRLVKIPMMLLALLLQFAPLARVVSLLPPPAMNMIIILFRWAAGGAAAFGGVQAVAGASTVITNPLTAKGTNGVSFVQKLTTAPDPAHWWSAAPLPEGVRLQGTSGNTSWFLTGTPTTPGVYRIVLTAKDVASSGSDRTTTGTLVLTVVPNGTPPSITQQPTGGEVEPGGGLALTATAAGTAPLRYQWLFNGSAVAQATNATLTLAGLESNRAGDYSLWVTNIAGSVTSQVAVVVVNGPPAITSDPSALTAAFGGSASFRVRAGGKLPLEYQWLKDGALLAQQTNALLTLPGLNSTSLGEYSVRVQNSLGAVTSSVARLLLDYGYTTNSVARLAYNASWRYNQTLNLDAVKWEAVDFNDSAWATGTGLLNVGSGSLPAAKGTTLTLGRMTYYFRTHFAFSGNPATTRLRLNSILDDGAVIYLNGFEIHRIGMDTNLANVVYTTPANRTVSTAVVEGPFILPGDRLVEGDNVLAVEVHQAASSSSDVVWGITLTTDTGIPNEPATLLAPLSGVEAPEGADVTLTAQAAGTGPLSYVWLFGNQPIAGQTSATLTLPAVTVGNAGPYSVIVSNHFGSAHSSASVNVIPNRPLQLELGAVANNQLAVSATLSAGRTYVVEWTDQLGVAESWKVLLSETPAQTGSVSWNIDLAGAPVRFLRLRVQ